MVFLIVISQLRLDGVGSQQSMCDERTGQAAGENVVAQLQTQKVPETEIEDIRMLCVYFWTSLFFVNAVVRILWSPFIFKCFLIKLFFTFKVLFYIVSQYIYLTLYRSLLSRCHWPIKTIMKTIICEMIFGHLVMSSMSWEGSGG